MEKFNAIKKHLRVNSPRNFLHWQSKCKDNKGSNTSLMLIKRTNLKDQQHNSQNKT